MFFEISSNVKIPESMQPTNDNESIGVSPHSDERYNANQQHTDDNSSNGSSSSLRRRIDHSNYRKCDDQPQSPSNQQTVVSAQSKLTTTIVYVLLYSSTFTLNALAYYLCSFSNILGYIFHHIYGLIMFSYRVKAIFNLNKLLDKRQLDDYWACYSYG